MAPFQISEQDVATLPGLRAVRGTQRQLQKRPPPGVLPVLGTQVGEWAVPHVLPAVRRDRPGGAQPDERIGRRRPGLMKQPMPGAPSAWLAYVDVDDVKASTEKVRSLGGQVLKDVTEVPQMGWFSVIADPTGAVLGLWQTAR